MLNRTGITKVTGAAPNQILFNVQNQMSVGIKLAKNFAGAVTENGRKIVKAGTLYPRNDASAIGIVWADYDVTDGDRSCCRHPAP